MSFFYGALRSYLPSSRQLTLLPTQLPRARRHVPSLLYSSEIQAPTPFETVHNTRRKFCFPSPMAPASKRQIGTCNVVVFCLVPISCSERCFRAPSPEQSWSCWSRSRGEPRAFPEQGWIKSPAPLG